MHLDEKFIEVSTDYSKIQNKNYFVFGKKFSESYKRKYRNYLLNFDINSGPYLYRLSENLFYNFLEDNEENFKDVYDNLERDDFMVQVKDC